MLQAGFVFFAKKVDIFGYFIFVRLLLKTYML